MNCSRFKHIDIIRDDYMPLNDCELNYFITFFKNNYYDTNNNFISNLLSNINT